MTSQFVLMLQDLTAHFELPASYLLIWAHDGPPSPLETSGELLRTAPATFRFDIIDGRLPYINQGAGACIVRETTCCEDPYNAEAPKLSFSHY